MIYMIYMIYIYYYKRCIYKQKIVKQNMYLDLIYIKLKLGLLLCVRIKFALWLRFNRYMD